MNLEFIRYNGVLINPRIMLKNSIQNGVPSRGYFILSRDQERRTRTDDRDPRNRVLSTDFAVILGENCEDIGSGEIIFVDLHTCTNQL